MSRPGSRSVRSASLLINPRADPIVRTQVIVTFRRDDALDMWVPEKMDEYYKAYSAVDDILATATYTNVRRILKSDLSEK